MLHQEKPSGGVGGRGKTQSHIAHDMSKICAHLVTEPLWLCKGKDREGASLWVQNSIPAFPGTQSSDSTNHGFASDSLTFTWFILDNTVLSVVGQMSNALKAVSPGCPLGRCCGSLGELWLVHRSSRAYPLLWFKCKMSPLGSGVGTLGPHWWHYLGESRSCGWGLEVLQPRSASCALCFLTQRPCDCQFLASTAVVDCVSSNSKTLSQKTLFSKLLHIGVLVTTMRK